jgi:hypothetical protein
MPTKPDYFKRRKVWWWNPWIIAVAIIFMVVAVPMVLWISTYNSVAAVLMFVITYLSLLLFVMYMVKISLLDPHVIINTDEIKKRKKEILDHRILEKSIVHAKDLLMLQKGEKSTVLDVWKLDPGLEKRHPFFSGTETCTLDPVSKELHIRIQIGEIQSDADHALTFEKEFLRSVFSYLKILGSDEHLTSLKPLLKLLVLEIYSYTHHPQQKTIPFPLFSLQLTATVLPQLTYTAAGDIRQMKIIGDVRFSGGNEITPHRGIISDATQTLS